MKRRNQLIFCCTVGHWNSSVIRAVGHLPFFFFLKNPVPGDQPGGCGEGVVWALLEMTDALGKSLF